jgi:type IV pilus assembly protein PilA
MKLKNNKAGFSLVELMVVVAIIGILATIAVPNFQKFQARAKQSNAKAELSGVYTVQRAFNSEHNTFHTNLPYVGYIPEGYNLDANRCPTGLAADATRVYSVGFGANGAGNSAVNFEVPGTQIFCGNAVGERISFYSFAAPNRDPGAIPAGSATTATTFIAEARGLITSGTRQDRWTINDAKVLNNDQSGI